MSNVRLTNKEDSYVIGTTPWAGTGGAVEMGTNSIPTDLEAKFIQFIISE